jgi:hypothetical protein
MQQFGCAAAKAALQREIHMGATIQWSCGREAELAGIDWVK